MKKIILAVFLTIFVFTMLFAQNTAEGKKLLSQGITAEQKGENLTALDLYIQARTVDKKNSDIQNHIDSVIESIAKTSGPIQNFNKKSSTDLKKSMKLRGEWDKIRIALEKLFEQYTEEEILKEYLIVYYPEIQTEELTSENYSTETINLSVKAPFLYHITSNEYQQYVYEREFAKKLKVILETIDSNNEWKISLKTHRCETDIENYICNDWRHERNYLVLLKENRTLSKAPISFKYRVFFKNIPLKDADMNKITLTIQKSELKSLPFDKFKEKYDNSSDFIEAEERIKNTSVGETISIKLSGEFNEHFYPLSRLAEAIRQCKGYVDLDISETYLDFDILGYTAELFWDNNNGVFKEVKLNGENGFKNCSSLIRIVLPKELKKMAYGTFMGCSALHEVVLQDELLCLGGSTFKNCSSLTEIFIPGSVSALWYDCTATYSYDHPNRLYVDSLYNSSIKKIYYANSSSKWKNIETSYKAWSETSLIDRIAEYTEEVIYIYDCPAWKVAEIKKEEAEHLAAERKAKEERLAAEQKAAEEQKRNEEARHSQMIEDYAAHPEKGVPVQYIVEVLKKVNRSTTIKIVGDFDTSYTDFYNAFLLCFYQISLDLSEAKTEKLWFSGCGNLISIILPSDIKEVPEGAFEDCESLKTVNYCGSKKQWKSIKIGKDNKPLLNAKINYNYKGK